MNKEQMHKYITESTGNESNICQIYAVKEGLSENELTFLWDT